MITKLEKASLKLSELELNIITEDLIINVIWFRAMCVTGDWIIKRHKHSSYEFHFIASGKCSVTLDDNQFIVEKGEFYITGPNIFHEQLGVGEDELIEYGLNCDIKLVGETATESEHLLSILNQTPCKAITDSVGIINVFEEALNEAYDQNFGFINNIKGLVMRLIFLSARAIASESSVEYKIPMKKKKEYFQFKQILEFIEDNVLTPLTTSDIAKQMYLSEKQIYRIVQQTKNISTKELIEQVKFNKAKELILQTDYSIKEIAEILGFSSEYYFNQFFKRREGSPPGLFRSIARNVY